MGTVWEGPSEKAQRRTHVWAAGWRVHSQAVEKALESRAGAAEGGAAARGSAASPPAFVRARGCRRGPLWRGGGHSGPLQGAEPASLALGVAYSLFRGDAHCLGLCAWVSPRPLHTAFDAVRPHTPNPRPVAPRPPRARPGAGDQDALWGCRQSGRERPDKAWGEREREGEINGGEAMCVCARVCACTRV